MALQSVNDSGQLLLKWEPQRRIFSVSELNSAVQRLLEGEFANVGVAGEISECRNHTSGHFYFTLKDGQSQLKCVLFKGTARFAKFKPQDGLAVLARGRLDVYEPRGEYRFLVDLLEPQGAGALQLAFEQLKKKLQAEGLFDRARKRELPKLPKRIGLVTSPAGAVIRDILHVLDRRFPGLHVRIFPAQVQGENSVQQVCDGLRFFSASSWAEVVIIARGGGSLEDLWTFNDESVARAIAACRVPVISAIGHETDFTIADFVADLRAPTPSAAAELVICTRESLIVQLSGCRAKAVQAIRYRLILASRDLHQRGTERASAIVHRTIAKRVQQFDDLHDRMNDLVQRSIESRTREFAQWSTRLDAANLRLRFARARHQQEILQQSLMKFATARLQDGLRRREALDAHLTQLSPVAVLSRGYAIVSDAHDKVLRSASETAPGEPVNIRLHAGRLGALVTSTAENNGPG
ncbi:MAG: exodeoxyribonuclease VII large subunit [Acidobacteriaceae bacterium]|nr:exodeoxyribonuclease VII large subunit [Acidobacteriaceae bacterium]